MREKIEATLYVSKRQNLQLYNTRHVANYKACGKLQISLFGTMLAAYLFCQGANEAQS